MKIMPIIIVLIMVAGTALGQKLPQFELKDTENNIKSYDDLKGSKITLVDFWATWCKPCLKAIPELNKIYDEYRSAGVEVIGISCDGPRSTAKVAPMVGTLQIKYPVLLDVNSDIVNNLNLASFPTLLVVDPSGKILYTHEGFETGDEIEIRKEIEKLLDR